MLDFQRTLIEGVREYPWPTGGQGEFVDATYPVVRFQECRHMGIILR